MARSKKSMPKHVEPEHEVQESPEKEPAVVIEALPKGAVSQSDAARAALDKGYEKPAEAVAYIKDTFGIEMNPQYFSAIKTRSKATQEVAPPKATPGKRGPKPKAAAPVLNGYVAPPVKPKAAGEPDVLLALESVKELVGTYGADRVRRIVDLLS